MPRIEAMTLVLLVLGWLGLDAAIHRLVAAGGASVPKVVEIVWLVFGLIFALWAWIVCWPWWHLR